MAVSALPFYVIFDSQFLNLMAPQTTSIWLQVITSITRIRYF